MRRLAWRAVVARIGAALALAILCAQVYASGGAVFAAALPAETSPSASCAQLAATSPTATNGSEWGKTILAGFDTSHGWFGVPVCANSYNRFNPGGANVSCAQAPNAGSALGCGHGVATSDGFGLSFQCVELVARFAKWAFGDAPGAWRGDAPYLWLANDHPADFRAFANGGAVAPMAGDVLVWGSLDSRGQPWPAGPAGGHVAVVENVSAHTISFVEENMLGHQSGEAFNIPRERTTLTRTSAGGWLIGPTYGENGGRALYGWLRSSRNTGRFPHTSIAPTPPPAPSTPTSPVPTSTTAPVTQPTHAAPTPTSTPHPQVTVPSLSAGVITTGDGALAQLVWSDTNSPVHPTPVSADVAAGIRIMAESLGAPAAVTFPPDQTPAVLSLPTGERYVFARGSDGALYSVYTAPSHPEMYWQSLGSPQGVKLTGSMTAIWDQAGLVVGGLGSDGALWLRAGPSGNLGDWVSLGAPTGATFIGAPALAAGPQASSSPAVSRVALALGNDGALYEADWTAPGWTQWIKASVNVPQAPLTGGLRVVSEPSSSGGAIDALATDTAGRLWMLRRASLTQPWMATSAPLPQIDAAIVGATLLTSVDSNKATSMSLQVYVANVSLTASAAHIEAATFSPGASANSLTWRPFDDELMSKSQPTTLALGAFGSALLTATNTAVSLIGADKLVSALTPMAQTRNASSAVAVGQIPAPEAFSDSFAGASIDLRWINQNNSAAPAVESAGALAVQTPRSAPQQSSIAQAAPPGSFTVTAHVAPGAGWSAPVSDPKRPLAEAGIQLALNEMNTLSLGLRSDGNIAFCPEAQGYSLPCSEVATPSGGTASSGVYLRIEVTGTTCTGAISLDGQTWTTVGKWTPTWLSGSGATLLGPYAPPRAAGASTTDMSAAHPQPFTSVRLYVTRATTTAAPSVTQPSTVATSVRFSAFTLLATAPAK